MFDLWISVNGIYVNGCVKVDVITECFGSPNVCSVKGRVNGVAGKGNIYTCFCHFAAGITNKGMRLEKKQFFFCSQNTPR